MSPVIRAVPSVESVLVMKMSGRATLAALARMDASQLRLGECEHPCSSCSPCMPFNVNERVTRARSSHPGGMDGDGEGGGVEGSAGKAGGNDGG